MRARRLTIALLVTAGMAALPHAATAQAPSGAFRPTKAVTWKVDYATRTITITVRMAFYARSQGGFSAAVNPQTVARIKQAIEAMWNGHRFKCFDVVVNVETRIVENQSDLGEDAVDVRLDYGSAAVRSSMAVLANAQYLSDDPGNAAEVAHDPVNPSTWSAAADPAVYAHEFGHVLGLHDNYDETKPGKPPLPGASEDLMFWRFGRVSADMITRVVRRSGQVDESKVVCAISMDAGPSALNLFLGSFNDFRIHAYTCDYDPPSTDPSRSPKPIEWKGTVGFEGEFLTQVPDIPFGRAGSYEGKLAYDFSPPGSMQIRVAKDLVVSGNVVWDSTGLPVALGPLSMSGVSTAMFFPGPPLEAAFSQGARECGMP